MTIEDWKAIPEDGNRYELIEGEIFGSRAPSLIHQLVITNLIAEFSVYLRNNPIGIVVTGPGMVFDEFNGVIPDLIFTTKQRRGAIAAGERLIVPPEIVIEILSPGSTNESRDRKTKRQLYARFGVQEYWIIDTEMKTIELYFLRNGILELEVTFSESDQITSMVLSDLRLDAKEIFNF